MARARTAPDARERPTVPTRRPDDVGAHRGEPRRLSDARIRTGVVLGHDGAR